MASDEAKSKVWGGSINDWSDAARKAGIGSLADQLVENETVKLSGREALKKLGLPHFKRLDPTPLSEFLQTPEKYFQQLEIPEYHVSLLSEVENKRRLRLGYLDRQGVLDFVHENVTANEEGKFTILIGEIKKNIYSGNIIIGKDGSFILEAAGPEVDHIDLVTGKVTPTIFGIRNPFLGALGIYTDPRGEKRLNDTGLTKIFIRTINCIPKDQPLADERIGYHPGYYEFVLIQTDDHSGSLTPIFIDYRDKNIYQMN